MIDTVNDSRVQTLSEYKADVQNFVLAGLAQVKEGRSNDIDLVCDRLEKKYHKPEV